jgi:ribosomal protein S18 acetylase RimI-like enzyme
VETKARAMGVKGIFLHTATGNGQAQGLFARSGYRPWETKKAFYPEGQDAVRMVKDLGLFPKE